MTIIITIILVDYYFVHNNNNSTYYGSTWQRVLWTQRLPNINLFVWNSIAELWSFFESHDNNNNNITLVPWCAGKPLTWDVTAVSTLADSYVESAAREAGAPAVQAAVRKIKKYSVLSQSYLFQPIAVEKTGVLDSSAIDFLNALGRRISSSSGKEREGLFLCQRISITMQRFNAILLHNCFVRDDPDL